MKKSKNELQQAIKALMDYYGIDDFNWYLESKILQEDDAVSYVLADELVDGKFSFEVSYWSNLERELAMLIQLLRSCKDSELTIKGKITHPHNNEIKGTEKEVTLTCVPFLQDLELILNNYMSADGIVDWCLHDDIEVIRKPIIINDFRWEKLLTGLHEPFADDEICEYFEQTNSYLKKKNNEPINYKLGRLANSLLYIVNAMTQGFTTRKRYSFLYDAMLLGGFVGKKPITDKGFSGDIGREKAQKVKDWLKAYEKDHNKFDPSKKW